MTGSAFFMWTFFFFSSAPSSASTSVISPDSARFLRTFRVFFPLLSLPACGSAFVLPAPCSPLAGLFRTFFFFCTEPDFTLSGISSVTLGSPPAPSAGSVMTSDFFTSSATISSKYLKQYLTVRFTPSSRSLCKSDTEPVSSIPQPLRHPCGTRTAWTSHSANVI